MLARLRKKVLKEQEQKKQPVIEEDEQELQNDDESSHQMPALVLQRTVVTTSTKMMIPRKMALTRIEMLSFTESCNSLLISENSKSLSMSFMLRPTILGVAEET
ncbi:hypothetical protein V6N11_042569 [Hibiscus sabdariffa]|uniref:Uncharacterized protein n=1 Tax=Hibiscus sabdariffa TaxID=183260 RepID=A0ABR2QWZ4_9ROSI